MAAIAVIYSHSYALLGLHEPQLQGIHVGTIAVFVFFTLSGLLITASWYSHPRVAAYAGKRALRILPALAVVLVLSTFLLGPIMTTWPLRQYFASNVTWGYLNGISIFGIVYPLPGVFQHNPFGALVNGSIWTLPFEILAYVLVAYFAKTKLLKHSRNLIIGALVCIALYYFTYYHATHLVIFNMRIHDLTLFITYFFAGMLLYHYRLKIRLTWLGAGIATGALVSAYTLGILQAVMFVALPYLVLFVGSLTWTGFERISNWGDFSYGTYIYAWPVQQTLIALHHNQIGPRRLFVYALCITLCAAILSWYLVEKPMLKLKVHFNPKRYPLTSDAW